MCTRLGPCLTCNALDRQLLVAFSTALVGWLTIPPLPTLIALLALAAVVVATISRNWRD